MPPSSTSSGSRRSWMPSASASLLDRERRVGVDRAGSRPRAPAAPPRRAPSGRRTRPSGRRAAVALHGDGAHRAPPGPSASGTSVRISKIEIIGRKRMNRNSSVEEQADRAEERRPVPERRGSTCPTTTAGSRGAGWSTMMTKRSSHMPTLTTIEIDEQRSATFARTRLNQSSCGDEHVADDQRPVEPARTGRDTRFSIMNFS